MVFLTDGIHTPFRQGHGGDVYRNSVKYDFSTSTNPFGMPLAAKEKLFNNIDSFERYPDIYCEELTGAISANENIASEKILCGGGASEILKLAVDAIRPKSALMAEPTFSGYEHALRGMCAGANFGVKIFCHYLKEENDFKITEDFFDALEVLDGGSIVFLCNPNNPTGGCASKKLLVDILDFCEARQIYMVVDECFLGFMSEYESLSMKDMLDSKFLIVVNAFTKLYAMAGLRLGWCACGDAALLEKMRRAQAEWSVSAPAQIAGAAAIKDGDYVARTRLFIKKEREKMLGWAAGAGLKAFPAAANFIMIKAKPGMYGRMLKKGILIRSCGDFKGLGEEFYRISIRLEEENEIFRNAWASAARLPKAARPQI